MAGVGTEARPLRVAVVGAGPSGFYAAAALFASDLHVRVDMIDRLPTPFGLVRGGVAPDHQKIKKVVRAYEKTARADGFRFLGGIRVGSDVTLAALQESYDQVVLAIGAESAKRLGIPGEELPGSHSATDFVGWYNGHPDHQEHQFDLSASRAAVVIGIGNVSMDVTRILLRDPDDLAVTDIADNALQQLRRSAIEDVYVLGRRGPAQAAFSYAEIKEISELPGVDLVVRRVDAELDPLSQAWLDEHGDRQARQNVAFLQEAVGRPLTGNRRVHMRLFTSPIQYTGDARVEAVEIGHNAIAEVGGALKPADTGERKVLQAGLVLRAVGYRGVPLSGAPFDSRRGIVPNEAGRVMEDGAAVPRLYVVGWAKRGPTGLIGTNRADSRATVAAMLDDVTDLPDAPREPAPGLAAKALDWAAWGRIDAAELAAGRASGKIREKFVRVEEMWAAANRAVT